MNRFAVISFAAVMAALFIATVATSQTLWHAPDSIVVVSTGDD